MASIQVRQRGCCAIAASRGQWAPIEELHHARIHDLGWARRKYPLFIDSLFNLVGVNHDLHMVNGSWGKWSEARIHLIERGLRRHPEHARKVNCG